jgi:hypothetical protein
MSITTRGTGIENHQTGIRDFHLGLKSSDKFSNVETSNLGRTLSTMAYAPPSSSAAATRADMTATTTSASNNNNNNRANSPGRSKNIDTSTLHQTVGNETKERPVNSTNELKAPWRTWFANTGGPKQTSSPLIPEPEFPRIAPTGTGISLRPYDIPPASLENIRNACHFYELKSSGKYSSKTLVGRYIFQLSREVQRQIVALEKADKAKTRRIEYLEDLVRNWEETFGRPSDDDLEKVFNKEGDFSPVLSPNRLAALLRTRLSENENLKDQMTAMLRTRQDDIDRAEQAIADHFKATRDQFRRDSDRLNGEVAAAKKQMQQEHEDTVGNDERKLAMMTNQMQASQNSILQKERNEIDKVVQAKVKQGLKDAITNSNKAIMETEAARRNHATEYLRKLSDVQKREQMVDSRLMGMRDRHEKDTAALKARYARLLADTQSRVKKTAESKATAVANMETENAWLRQRVADLQEMVVAFQDAMSF